MKIVTVVGARPQFIKAAMVSDELKKRKNCSEVLVHTGQHFDYNMSEHFFEELNISHPDYNLGISGGTHAQMTATMMIELEKVLIKEHPDWILLYGDTNSTLAGALSSVKLHIPICHVEAGSRMHCLTNPEEVNRICTDHVSSLLLCSAQSHLDELINEGLHGFFVGNIMYDAFLKYSNYLNISEIQLESFDGDIVSVPDNYYYLTCHREENSSDDFKLTEILNAVDQLEAPTVFPVHPRNKERVQRIRKMKRYNNILFCSPIGYIESVCLVNNSKKIITDSGGLQTEAFFAKKKCVTILDFVCWPETMVGFRNELCHPSADDILEKLSHEQTIDESYNPFGDGHAAKRIVEKLIGSL